MKDARRWEEVDRGGDLSGGRPPDRAAAMIAADIDVRDLQASTARSRGRQTDATQLGGGCRTDPFTAVTLVNICSPELDDEECAPPLTRSTRAPTTR